MNTDIEREPIQHTLKTDFDVFQAVANGRKKFEILTADRDFRVGDTLNLLETVSTGAEMAAGAPLEYTGGQLIVRVTHIIHGPRYGLAAGWCLMSIEDVPCGFDPDAVPESAAAAPLGWFTLAGSRAHNMGQLAHAVAYTGSVHDTALCGAKPSRNSDGWYDGLSSRKCAECQRKLIETAPAEREQPRADPLEDLRRRLAAATRGLNEQVRAEFIPVNSAREEVDASADQSAAAGSEDGEGDPYGENRHRRERG